MKKKALIFAAVLILCFVAVFAYLNDYYPADAEAVAVLAQDFESVDIYAVDAAVVFAPKNASAGLAFYPGGKVEYSAYAPLMQACAEEGIACVLFEMPFNLAVLDVDAAEGAQALLPDIERWYIGGHSLGGSMAASYLADKAESFDGLILLGSYSTVDFSDASLSALSIYGSEDAVMNREKYDECKMNMPSGFSEIVIDGGNHAGFGAYGKQEGDGQASISNAEQIELTVKAIAEFINNS